MLDLEGADHDFIDRAPGDIGSPIIVDLGSGVARGVGIHSGAGGEFARLGDYLNAMGGSVVTTPGRGAWGAWRRRCRYGSRPGHAG